MDEYGVFRSTAEDYDVLVGHIKAGDCFTFTYCEDGATAHIVSFCKTKRIGGPLPWGGSITGMTMIAVRRHGAEFFDLFHGGYFAPTYIEEKLNLGKGDALQIAHLMNELRERLK